MDGNVGPGWLLDPTRLFVVTDQRVENGQDVAAVLYHAREDVAQLRIALGLTMPLRKHRRGNLDVTPKGFRGVPAEEQAVEKRRLALRKLEIAGRVGRHELWHRGHKESAVYRKVGRRQVGLGFACCVPSNSPVFKSAAAPQTPSLHRAFQRNRMLGSPWEIRLNRKRSFSSNLAGRMIRFSALRSLRSVEVDPEAFRKDLAEKHRVWVPNFERMSDVPLERLDAIGARLIRQASQLALAEGVGFGFGGFLTVVPDTSLLVIITLRLIQRLSLLYGLRVQDPDQRLEMWKATAAAAGVDFGKDLAEKQLFERIGPRIARALAAKMSAEAAEKWAGRLIPLASSAVGGGLNYAFVRAWGRRAQLHLREQHLQQRGSPSRVIGEHPLAGPGLAQ